MKRVILLVVIVALVTACVPTLVHKERVKDDVALVTIPKTASVNMEIHIYTTPTAIVPHMTATPRQWYGGGKRQGMP